MHRSWVGVRFVAYRQLYSHVRRLLLRGGGRRLPHPVVASATEGVGHARAEANLLAMRLVMVVMAAAIQGVLHRVSWHVVPLVSWRAITPSTTTTSISRASR